ncbi:DUF51 family protein [Cardiosporidium cionae]|uniref:DUF51 family protein n=1 Tax=Cardiosporidium cionae TaxID=476202 RepID=A0ABQ7JCE4_9APIC|nr:DUF51 family protein [Cardiosporidium cionae]|eukprot:KAF8821687.1 DUF51 family protein [Cardiosporidium cionae]
MFATTSNHKKDGSPGLFVTYSKSSNDKSIPSSPSNLETTGSCSTRVSVNSNGIVEKIELEDEISNTDAKLNQTKRQKKLKIYSGGRTIKNLEASEVMAAWCFDLLINELKGNRLAPAVPTILRKLAEDDAKCSVFVTWMKKRSGHEHVSFDKARTELRGCIGCLEPIPILSLAFWKCDHVYEWEIGTHGIIVNFTDYKGRRVHSYLICDLTIRYSATFLPEIARENKMSHKVTIHELIRKSQFIGPITDNLIERIEVTRYQSSKVELTYDQYISHFAFK